VAGAGLDPGQPRMHAPTWLAVEILVFAGAAAGMYLAPAVDGGVVFVSASLLAAGLAAFTLRRRREAQRPGQDSSGRGERPQEPREERHRPERIEWGKHRWTWWAARGAAILCTVLAAFFTVWALLFLFATPVSGYAGWTEVQAMHHYGGEGSGGSFLLQSSAPAWYGPLMPGIRTLSVGEGIGLVLLTLAVWLPVLARLITSPGRTR
jgi:hypothetical protein